MSYMSNWLCAQQQQFPSQIPYLGLVPSTSCLMGCLAEPCIIPTWRYMRARAMDDLTYSCSAMHCWSMEGGPLNCVQAGEG
jgi:hypothetical protein